MSIFYILAIYIYRQYYVFVIKKKTMKKAIYVLYLFNCVGLGN